MISGGKKQIINFWTETDWEPTKYEYSPSIEKQNGQNNLEKVFERKAASEGPIS